MFTSRVDNNFHAGCRVYELFIYDNYSKIKKIVPVPVSFEPMLYGTWRLWS